MSYSTSPYLLHENHYGYGHDAFNEEALMKRYGKYDPNAVVYDCPYQPVPLGVAGPALVVSPPCCPELAGQDVLGIGVNHGILNYQFGSSMNVPFCGAAVNGCMLDRDCKKCPCQSSSCATLGSFNPECDYGFARNPCSAFGPTGGNRNGNLKWG